MSNYQFKTLQASGVEINRKKFTTRDTENRYEAINSLREYVAPNYIIRTQGDNKIWSSFLSQRPVEDFSLNLTTQLNYLEDTDLYTRVVFYGQNSNPTNLMFNDGVSFLTTDEEYKGYASLSELTFIGDGGGTAVIPPQADETYQNWILDIIANGNPSYYYYVTGIPNAGAITIETIIPTVYIDNNAINNIPQQVVLQPVNWQKTTT